MDAPRPRAAVVIGLAILLAGLGLWLGEAGGPAWAPMPMLVGLIGCAVLAVLITGGWIKKLGAAVGMFVVYGIALFFGHFSFSYAFAECIEKGEHARIMLNEYRRAKGTYPEALRQLEDSVPCNRLSGRTILSYERTANGYELRFRDWLVEHTATESDSFIGDK